jgi:polysaccharide pyruvyl transferase WcaK-like protein
MPIQLLLPIQDIRMLWSNDYPNMRVGELTRTDYPNRAFVFEDLYNDIHKNGITTPLRVVNDRLVDGHHRAIIAMELGIETIPIEYSGYYL